MRWPWIVAIATPLALLLLFGWQVTLMIYLVAWAIGIPATVYFWWWMHTWPHTNKKPEDD